MKTQIVATSGHKNIIQFDSLGGNHNVPSYDHALPKYDHFHEYYMSEVSKRDQDAERK